MATPEKLALNGTRKVKPYTLRTGPWRSVMEKMLQEGHRCLFWGEALSFTVKPEEGLKSAWESPPVHPKL